MTYVYIAIVLLAPVAACRWNHQRRVRHIERRREQQRRYTALKVICNGRVAGDVGRSAHRG